MDRIDQEREKLHILCNNAGISLFFPPPGGALCGRVGPGDPRQSAERLFVRQVRPAPAAGGRTSLYHQHRLHPSPDVRTHTEAYSASKGGILALTHALAVSLGPTVRVNAISPGWIETSEWKKKSARKPATDRGGSPAAPLGKGGPTEDIARAVRYLASPDAEFITGANLVTRPRRRRRSPRRRRVRPRPARRSCGDRLRG